MQYAERRLVPPSRPYSSAVRDAAAAETRARLVAAAGEVLRDGGKLSLDAVARRAGVTRLTVYNQFGSRRGLLEAVFDDRAAQGGLHRLEEALAETDGRAAARRVVAIFCDFWSSDGAVARLHDAVAGDPEFAAALTERHQRRRHLWDVLTSRLGLTSAGLVDVLTALTSQSFYAQLAVRNDPAGCETAISELVERALDAELANMDGEGR